jgi:hypothetical protein
VEDPTLLEGCPQRGAIAIGVDFDVTIVQEVEHVATADVVKVVAGKLELFRPRANGCDRRAEI